MRQRRADRSAQAAGRAGSEGIRRAAYDHYDFLLTISDYLGGNGLEHHRSSEDGTGRGYFTDWENKLRDRNLLPHEFSHSWDGKFRRPADLWTPDYRTPMQDSGLWVYEGQTQFWGYVLGARSGMLSKEDTLDAIAATAASYSLGTPGRAWRPLIDTTNDPIIASRQPQPWRSWQRAEDYYSEGQLIWLDVDRIIRQQSGGKRSIDDFAKAFFGIRDRDWGEVTYTLDDIVATLNKVQPYDWRAYLQRRVYDVAPEAPLEGITKGGYRLVYTSEPTKWWKSNEKDRKVTDLTYSGGLVVGSDGKVSSVLWDSPAFNSGMTIGDEILAVNGRHYDGDALKSAIKAASGQRTAVQLLIKAEISTELSRSIGTAACAIPNSRNGERSGHARRTACAALIQGRGAGMRRWLNVSIAILVLQLPSASTAAQSMGPAETNVQTALARVAAVDPLLHSVIAAGSDCNRSGAGGRQRKPARAARRTAGTDQGQYRKRRGAADNGWQSRTREQCHQPRCAAGRAAALRGRSDPRQDQP